MKLVLLIFGYPLAFACLALMATVTIIAIPFAACIHLLNKLEGSKP